MFFFVDTLYITKARCKEDRK